MISLLLTVFLAAVLIRSRWIVWQAAQYATSAIYWTTRTKQPISITKEMSEIWSFYQIFLRFWIWDFRHFVVHQDHYDAMQVFLLAELEREDRGPEIFEEDQKPDTKEDTHGRN